MPDSLAFRFYRGHMNGPRVFAQARSISGLSEVSWMIVGASHLIHYTTPCGEFTEAIADPSRLPQGCLFEKTLESGGSWANRELAFAIRWEILEVVEPERLKSLPLVYDFGGGALTAIDWELEDGLICTRTYHLYPECGKVVETVSRAMEAS